MGRLDNVQWIKEEMQLADTLAKLGICNKIEKKCYKCIIVDAKNCI